MSTPDAPDTDLDAADERHLDGLGGRMNEALEARRNHDVDAAAEILREILRTEPRLAEPRMELAHLLLETGMAEEAEAEAREAVRILDNGGQWNEDVPENVMLSLALSTLGESMRVQLDHDDAVFGDPEVYARRMAEARAAFKRAVEIDPTNDHAHWWAYGYERGGDEAEAAAVSDPPDAGTDEG